MEKDSTAKSILSLNYNTTEHSVSLELNWLILGSLILVIGLIWFIRWRMRKNKVNTVVNPVELEIEIGGVKCKYEIKRNYENLEIAHRLYVELVTRKAAMEFDETHDVITEIYDSWYSLFKITREEMKGISGETLETSHHTSKLIEMGTDILNKGLRPHLTKYQAKYRKWYNEQSEKHEGKSPQEIQAQFKEIKELTASMKEVNTLLINYSKELKKFIETDISKQTNT